MPSASSNSPFSFLASSNTFDTSLKTQTTIPKSSASNGAPKGNENGTNKKESSEVQISSSTATTKNATDKEDQNKSQKSSDYFRKLKGLNESVAQWIKTHVDSNPFCILTPIFKDYEKYLKEIETKHGKETEKIASKLEQTQPVQVSENKESSNTEKKIDGSSFGGASAKSPLVSTEWKPEKSVFGNINTSSKSVFGKSEHTMDGSKSVFSTEQAADTPKSVFGNTDHKAVIKSIFGNISTEKNPFLSKTPTVLDNKSESQDSKLDSKSTSGTFSTTNTFCFGQSSTTSNTTGFSFGR